MKLGVVGTGTIAAEVLPLLRGWGWEPVAICGTPRSKGTVDRLCAEHQVSGSYVDYPTMLKEADVDTIYIAVPNFLHYEFVKMALESGLNVIVEKPMTSNDKEATALRNLTKEKNLYLFEAISTIYLPNYAKIREWLSLIGTVKIVSCNFCQYSRRYDAFRTGEILPVFDPEKSGGAMMDLNLYNLHWLIGLFGAPQNVHYQANIERQIDTSGIVTLDYGRFQAVSIAAKDCAAPCNYVIQGTNGYIQQTTPANSCYDVKIHLNDGTEETHADNPINQMEPEFTFFAQQIASGNRAACYEILKHSVMVSRVQTQARLGAGIRFPSDD